MSTALATTPDIEAIEQVLVNGDLARLNPAQRVSYYNRVCESLDLNPLTKPFDYISLNGKLVLYAKRDATEQLRSRRGVSVQIVARELVEDCYIVTARASLPNGRQDESIGAVNIAGLKGENRANALMKAETKAKRRVTLSICGLGLLDETEVDTVEKAGYIVEPPVDARKPEPQGDPTSSGSGVAPSQGGIGAVEPPDGAVLIQKVSSVAGKAKGFVHVGENSYPVYNDALASLAAEVSQNREPVTLTFKTSAAGKQYVIGIARVMPEALKPFAKEPEPLEPDTRECEGCGRPVDRCTCDVPF